MLDNQTVKKTSKHLRKEKKEKKTVGSGTVEFQS
jgi:hypothetical protein